LIAKKEAETRILVFSKTMGFKHSHYPKDWLHTAVWGRKIKFSVDTTKNADIFNDEILKAILPLGIFKLPPEYLGCKQEAALEEVYLTGWRWFCWCSCRTRYEYGWKLVMEDWSAALFWPAILPVTQKADFYY